MSDNLKREAELIKAGLASLPEEGEHLKQVPAAEPAKEQLGPKQKLAAIILAIAEQPSAEPMPPMSEAQQARWANLLKRARS